MQRKVSIQSSIFALEYRMVYPCRTIHLLLTWKLIHFYKSLHTVLKCIYEYHLWHSPIFFQLQLHLILSQATIYSSLFYGFFSDTLSWFGDIQNFILDIVRLTKLFYTLYVTKHEMKQDFFSLAPFHIFYNSLVHN